MVTCSTTPRSPRPLRGPQFLPQLLKLPATGDAAGVSWAWAALTCLNNGAWMAYFALAPYWTALIPSSSATTLARTLAIDAHPSRTGGLPARDCDRRRAAMLAGPSLPGGPAWGRCYRRVHFRSPRPSGPPTGPPAPPASPLGPGCSWLGELSCWLAFGLHKSDPRLMILGAGVITAAGSSSPGSAALEPAGWRHRCRTPHPPGEVRLG